jgi:hypothetical protein
MGLGAVPEVETRMSSWLTSTVCFYSLTWQQLRRVP